jgi:hypothetical protein
MSFAHLSAVGTLSYNGYTFDGASEVKVNTEFVRDGAERTVVYARHTIEVHAFVSDGSSTDSQLQNIRARLSHQGQALQFIDKGFGDDLRVNVPGGIRDVKWGPKPEILHWQPLGSAGACEVVWRVSTCVPDCGNGASDRTSGVMAHNYGITFAIDVRGLTTRTITGYIEIAQTRAGIGGINSKNVPDSADQYRNYIQPDLPDGFQREQEWTISDDKSRVNFTIVDRQLPTNNPYPVLVTNIRANHRTHWGRGRDAMALRQSIDMDVELAKGAPRVLGYRLFGELVKQRVDYAARQGNIAILDSVDANESIFGLDHSFSCTYRLITPLVNTLNSSPGDLLSGSAQNANVPATIFDFSRTGMWQQVGTNWSQWRSSISHVFSNRGIAGLQAPAQNDVIIDLCDAGVTISTSSTQPPPQQPVAVLAPVVRNVKPPPRQSYLTYKQRVAIRHEKYLARQKPLQPTPADGAKNDMTSDQGMNFSVGQSSGQSTPTADTIQESGPGSFFADLIGSALRVGYQIPKPAIVSVGGVTPVEQSARYIMEHVGNWFGLPVFRAAWWVSYMLPSPPANVSAPPKLEG